jgi:dipeptidyl aminopeptidase/acylaminoacyl peptidase
MKKIWVVKLATFAAIACGLLCFTSSVGASKDNLPRLPGGMLLVGHFSDDLAVTIGEKTTRVQGGGEWEVIPSMSADGRVLASARMIPGRSLDINPTFLVGTYMLASGRWTEYRDLEIKGGSIAISPDGSKLACSNMATGPSLLHILDLKTGKISVGPEVSKHDGFLTWSPDSRRIAFVRDFLGENDDAPSSLLPEIYVLNVEDGKASKIAEGAAPSWSPSGEWIAFSDYSAFRHGKYANTGFRLSMIHPDGAGYVELLKQGKDLFVPAVWSPDSKYLLLQRPQDEEVNPSVNIDVLEVATLKLTGKFKKSPEVYGWAAAR